MSQKPSVSIIVPVFNVDKYLPDCINSILRQLYSDFELLLVDDGSTDNSGVICDEYAINDNRIKVIHKDNSGVSEARNLGLSVAVGKYISFIDADDVVDKNFINILVKNINGCQISMCYFKIFSDNEKIKETTVFNEKIEVDENEFWNMNFGMGFKASCCNKLFLSSLFKNASFNRDYRFAEDDFIMHKITGQCDKIAVTSDVLYFYRNRDDSASHKKNKEDVTKRQILLYIERSQFYLYKKNITLSDKWYYKCFSMLLKNYINLNLKKEFKDLKKLYKIRKKECNLYSKTEDLFFISPWLYYLFSKMFKKTY